MSSSQSSRSGKRTRAQQGRPRVEGAKREEILAAATERFGRDGYDDTKWADIAADVGVGPTALYHYFESKQHCLFVIMDRAIVDARARFETFTADDSDYRTALRAVLRDWFDLSERDVLRTRLVVSEQGLLARPRASPREEEARREVRGRMRDLELAWAGFLDRGMRQEVIPRSAPRLLARAVLGLYNSIWQWYRPNGTVSLLEATEFFTERILALLGVTNGDLEFPGLAA